MRGREILFVGAVALAALARPAAAQTNVAINKPVSVSSNDGYAQAASTAVDGSLTTRWASAWSDPQWITVDLGGTYSVSRVVLRWEAAFGRAYQIQTSGDGSAWTTLYSTTTGDGAVDDLSVSGSGRYLRMYGTARGTAYGYSLWELEVYGAAAATPTTPPSGGFQTGVWYSLATQTSGKCVDVRANGTANGTVVQQYTCNSGYAQQWALEATSGGYYRVNGRTNPAQVMDVTGGSSATGDSVGIQLWAYSSGTNQQWQPQSLGNGYYRFVARHSGKCLDVPAASTADSVALQQYTCNGTAAQSFRFVAQSATPTSVPPTPTATVRPTVPGTATATSTSTPTPTTRPTTTSTPVPNQITIDVNSVRQGIDGIGFCHEGDRINGDTYVFDARINQMLATRMSLFRDMLPGKAWEPGNDNGDVNSLNWGAFATGNVRVQNSFTRLKEMQSRGIRTILGIWDVPNWMVSNPSAGSNRRINNMDEFAEFITAYLLWGKNNYGLTVDFVDVNETKTSGVNIYLDATEYASLIQKCQPRFTANGLTTKMNIGSVLLWDQPYLQQVHASVAGLSVAGYPSFHTYKGGSTQGREPIDMWNVWGAWQQQLGRHLWATETDYDAFYWLNPEATTYQGVEEMAVMYWRNFYVSHVSTSAGWFWRTDFPSHNVHLAYMNYFERGGEIVQASQPFPDVMTLAYRHTVNNKFVLQVVNQAGGRTVTFGGIPNTQLTLLRTSAAGDRYRTVGTYQPSGGSLTVYLEPDSFNTFAGNLH